MTGEDQPGVIAIGNHVGLEGGGGRRVILYEITHPARSEFTTSYKHTAVLFQIELKATTRELALIYF